ncbi:hypothetical protein LJR016_002833 [Devosia sp. LjRoot16]|uniref:tetratricopeptide repeat protein n=1 Tax=Devosia sp. LjRoot16 TaxID=3342271 RepID=UPI003ECF35F4
MAKSWVSLVVGVSIVVGLTFATLSQAAELADPSQLRPRCVPASPVDPLPALPDLKDSLSANADGAARCSALDQLEALAIRQGDVEAAMLVGNSFAGGVLVDRDLKRSEAAYLLAFDLGSAEAALKLGDLRRSIGDATSVAAATAYYEDARSLGAVEAALRLGDYFVTANDGAMAAASYAEAADAGVAEANLRLAELYQEGRLVPRDLGLARSHLQQAVDAGSDEAVVALALLQLDSGDAGGAVAALKAAASANPRAALALGDLYRDGRLGVPEVEEAIASYQLAATAGSTEAWLRIGDLQRDARSDAPGAAQAYQEALAKGDATAGLRLGDLYAAQPASAPDGDAALESYVAAFALGADGAAARIGQHLLEQGDVAGAAAYFQYAPEDVPAEAALPIAEAMSTLEGADRQGPAIVEIYHRAYQAGQYVAAVRLGDIYFDGKLVARDVAAAERFYQLAGAAVPPQTLLSLADARLEGTGVPVDRSAALDYYRRALSGGVAVAGLKLGTALAASPQAGDEAVEAFVRAAELGEVSGYLLAGELQQEHEPAAAAALYEEALAAGISEAAGHLGDMQLDGVLGAPDVLRASAYYQQSPAGIPSRALLPIADALASLDDADALDHAVELYERSLAEGNADAAGRLGALYLSEALGPSDPAKAEQYFEQAPTGAPVNALIALGNAYRDGSNVEVNGLRASQYYRSAVAAGDVAANQLLGDLYFEGKLLPADPVQATQYYEAAGSVPDKALLTAGDVYRDGAIGSPDGSKALDYYARADQAGLVEASTRMAELYFSGALVPRDIGKATELFERSPKGVPDGALLEIADYLQGRTGDEPKARHYYEAALERGQGAAAGRLGDIFFYGRGTGSDLAQAEHYYELSPSGVPDEANLVFGDAYRDGTGVAADGQRARRYYEAALVTHPQEAAERLASMLYSGELVPRDLAAAAGYYDRWTSEPPTAVLADLGNAFVTGADVPADVARGVTYLSRAADAGDVGSLVRLGGLLRDGVVVPKDLQRAAGYLLRAARAGEAEPLLALADDYLDQPAGAAELNPGVELLREAASADVPGAAVSLAEALVTGRGTLPDGAAAAAVLEVAVGRGDAGAGLALIQLYRRGATGLPPQPKEAQRVYDTVATSLPAQQAIAEKLMLTVGSSGLPRSSSDLAESFALLEPAVKADVLLEMRGLNENGYVFLLQSEMRDRGLLVDEDPSGQLTKKTIRAMMTLCTQAGGEDACLAGPMSEASGKVITSALR